MAHFRHLVDEHVSARFRANRRRRSRPARLAMPAMAEFTSPVIHSRALWYSKPGGPSCAGCTTPECLHIDGDEDFARPRCAWRAAPTPEQADDDEPREHRTAFYPTASGRTCVRLPTSAPNCMRELRRAGSGPSPDKIERRGSEIAEKIIWGVSACSAELCVHRRNNLRPDARSRATLSSSGAPR